MILRVVTVTTLLIAAFAIELALKPGQTVRPLFVLSAGAYGMVLAYAVLDRWMKGTLPFIYLQIVGDALVVTAFVRITGGIDSPMSFLYLLPIAVASMLLLRRGGLTIAGVCFAFYAALVLHDGGLLGVGRFLGPIEPAEPWRTSYFLIVHAFSFVAVALLSSYLAERVQRQSTELDARDASVARLTALNENIIESIHSGLITTDLEGIVNFMNRGGAEIIGRSQGNVLGAPIASLLGLDPAWRKAADEALGASRRHRFERYTGGPEGSRIFLGIAVSNLKDRDGLPLGYIFTFQDLTELYAAEQQMRLKERMAALGQMAAGMAHELRNPLAAISGSVQYLKGDLRPSGETLELMDIILRESQRLDQAIRDFLTFARPGRFAPQRADVVRLLEDHLKLLRKSREFTGAHRLETRYASASLRCDVDPNRMKQVFWNLSTNALKAMPQGGALTITVAEDDARNEITVAFADEGVGMDERTREGYFQPFRSAFDEGTGLGAAIVYRLVEEHGGRIAVESTPGRGTTVSVTVPKRRGSAVDEVEAPLTAAGGIEA
ncbi:MAG TPA: ATP-binding protein [Candidatus Polarisedimenticolaceae bacterium]|nr:ATP-binding protein [Candidatus Polarisedimenticolaceae bacterium]